MTGMGAASSLGTGVDAHRVALFAGRDGIRPVERFDTSRMSTRVGATWPGWEGRVQLEVGAERDLFATAAPFPLHDLALAAAREAWADARPQIDRRRVALVFGTCFGHGFTEFSAVAERVASALEILGPCVTISTACSSSTNAIGLARDLLVHGHADLVVAGGADSLLREAFAGFSALGVLSAEPCAPFSTPTGTTLGEGAAFLVLERAADASRRGARATATICGYGLSADGFHETTPDPSGSGVARAIRGALADAGWSASDVDFVSAHATGTENNDRIEWSVIERELGTRNVSGAKGHVGHTQGAAGALELVLALLCQREGYVPPTLHFRGPREGCPADPIAGAEPRPLAVSRALKLSAAFGGANAVVAYGREDEPPRASRERARVVVAGMGVVGPSGSKRGADVADVLLAQNVGKSREPDLDGLGVDGRRLDRSARFLTGAAALALAGRERAAMERTGLFVASTRMPDESSKRCTESIRLRGIGATSASAFARMSVNAPSGACAQALGLLGPTSTLSIGRGSGLLAIALAAEWLAFRDDAGSIVAGAVNELSERAGDEVEGAACLVLARAPEVAEGAVAVAAWAIEGPRAAREAAERAMSGRAPVDALLADADGDLRAFLAPNASAGAVDASRAWGASEATRSAVMAAVAAAQVASGRARSALVVAARGASSVALVFEATR